MFDVMEMFLVLLLIEIICTVFAFVMILLQNFVSYPGVVMLDLC